MLHDLQAAFRSAVLLGDAAAACSGLVSDRVAADRRLAIHRHNVLASLTEALRATFPVAADRLGERFPALAQAFVEAAPPRRPQLLAYGDGFPAFLATHLPDPGDAALPDLARLEWARVEACFAAEAEPLRPDRLAAVPPDRSSDICFRLHPTVRMVASAYPLLALWAGTAPDRAAAGAVLVLRSGGALEMAALSTGEFAFLRMVRAGTTLDVAAATAAAADPGFALQAVLAAQFARGTFCGFSLHPA